ncbi:MAG: trypsin-like peptidase domain-containing protein [Lentisphaeria bacterium]|jgi:S1-C subfamily serine protease|nr:trypsin-like peptidase domain-containing protein [Lentisphaeria bacterium]
MPQLALFSRYRLGALLAVGFLAFPLRAEEAMNLEQAMRSVIRIQATTMQPDLTVPWNAGRIGRGTGSGFVIDGNRVITNAHVVSNARFLGLQRPDSPITVPATVAFVAHDCDLAILEVADPSFFAGLVPLPLGGVPGLDSAVVTVGYPVGGNRASVTRGIVSRIEFQTYAHSGLDAHLTIQTDAAINPGNSGGPVMQDGRVVGVAFQGIPGALAQNTGYMIPTPVIERFLGDIADGRYDGYPELAIGTFNLLNRPARAHYGLAPDGNEGQLVTSVQPQGSCDGLLERGDVLLSIDGHPILSDGQIDLDGERILMVEVVERKFIGDKVVFGVLRAGRKLEVEVTLKGAWFYHYRARQHDTPPRYLVFAGLVFQPVNYDLMRAYQVTEPTVLDAYEFFISDEVYVERPEILVLGNILADPINTYLDDFRMGVVDSVNGQPIGTLAELDAAFSAPAERYVVTFLDGLMPLVLEADKVTAARDRIARQYGIEQDKHIGRAPHEGVVR